jgi:hypothetical protein
MDLIQGRRLDSRLGDPPGQHFQERIGSREWRSVHRRKEDRTSSLITGEKGGQVRMSRSNTRSLFFPTTLPSV